MNIVDNNWIGFDGKKVQHATQCKNDPEVTHTGDYLHCLYCRIEELQAQVDARQWKIPEDRYTPGILIVEVDMSDGNVCRGMVIQDDEDYNELLVADEYMDVWTDFRWPDIDRYYVLPSPQAAIKGEK